YLFAVPWTAFSLFWESMAILALFGALSPENMPNPAWSAILLPLFGLPFLAIGFYMMATPFIAYTKALETVYAITSQRALTVTGKRNQEVLSYAMKDISEHVEIKRKHDGSGHLYFSFKRKFDSDGDPYVERKGFEHIANVKEAEMRLRQA